MGALFAADQARSINAIGLRRTLPAPNNRVRKRYRKEAEWPSANYHVSRACHAGHRAAKAHTDRTDCYRLSVREIHSTGLLGERSSSVSRAWSYQPIPPSVRANAVTLTDAVILPNKVSINSATFSWQRVLTKSPSWTASWNPRNCFAALKFGARKKRAPDACHAAHGPSCAKLFLRENSHVAALPNSRVTKRVRHEPSVLSTLINQGYLASEGPRDPVRLGLPAAIIDRWFPRL